MFPQNFPEVFVITRNNNRNNFEINLQSSNNHNNFLKAHDLFSFDLMITIFYWNTSVELTFKVNEEKYTQFYMSKSGLISAFSETSSCVQMDDIQPMVMSSVTLFLMNLIFQKSP